MMKKRKSPAMPGDNDDDDSEMVDVGGEEKMETAANDESDNEDAEELDAMEERDITEDNSFMDTFYGLSSSNPMERSKAANTMLSLCLTGPQANIKDAVYALRRLLNGLCSGRAASRQGNASALASFLRLSLEGGQLHEIKNQDDSDQANVDKTILEFVRYRLLKATDPTSTAGKKKGSEERDYQFGRLFGILSVARSGILLPKKGSDMDNIMEVSSGFVSDLVELYNDKKWMREPAAHAIGTMLRMFYADSNGINVATRLVEDIVVPKLLLSNGAVDIKNLEAEKIALFTTIQAHAADHPKGRLPVPLDQPIISTETIATIATVLVETSSVALPRTHLVWDSLWLYLTEPSSPETPSTTKKSGTGPVVRELRKVNLIGTDSPHDVIEALVQNVILEKLLRVDNEGGAKATHEKRALALCLVRTLLGVPFNSSIAGPTQILLEPQYLEAILTPSLIRRLFLDVICAGGGSSKKAHTLKPLVLQILGSMVHAMTQDNSETAMNRRLRLATAFIQCEPRFDALTKTTTIADLVGFGDGNDDDLGAAQMATMKSYIDFLKEQSLLSSKAEGEKLVGYIDTLHQSSKRLLRLASADEIERSQVGQFSMETVEEVLGFFMANSFFDCESFSSKSSKKEKKGKSRAVEKSHIVVDIATRITETRKNHESEALSFASRSILSERFYSLLAEYVISSMHSGRGSVAKDSTLLDIVERMFAGWKALEMGGAKPLFCSIANTDGLEGDSQSPGEIVSQLQRLAKEHSAASATDPDNATLRAKKRCATGCAALASSLFLHLLGCGRPEAIADDDDVTTEDDDDSAEILDALEGIGDVTPLFLKNVDAAEGNPLASFAEVCIDVLSSRVCSGSPGRGASPRLLREAVKFAWMGVLSVSATSSRTLLDSDAVTALLSGIGAYQNHQDGADGEEMEEEDGSDENETYEDRGDDDNSVNERSDVLMAGKILDDADEDDDENNVTTDSDDKTGENKETDDDLEDEEEINQEKLHALLEDDSDAGIEAGELEHHEGADAALAKLLKVRQEARKAGQQALERLELEKQLRCTLLLETLLGKSESWGSLLRSDIVLQMVIPMLSYRNKLEKSLPKSSGEANDSTVKKAMLDRLSSILKSKLLKLKLSTMPSTEAVDMAEICSSLAASLLDMVRGSNSKDQKACSSACLAVVVKALSSKVDDIVKVASIYASAVDEWSTKRSSHLEVSLFDELINHSPSVAQVVLVPSLTSAAIGARSPFLRCESFRLLSILFNPKLNPGMSEIDELAAKKMQDYTSRAVAAVCATLKDEDMQKAKRIRDVLKAAEKVLDFAKQSSRPLPDADGLSQVLEEAYAKVQNQGAKVAIEKIRSIVDEWHQEPMTPVDDDMDERKDSRGDDDEDEAEDRDNSADEANKKEKKKKKKKKKRGKK